MTPQEQAAAVRRGAGLFELGGRGLIAVTGSDRRRWLDGMVSNDVASLEAGPDRSGCYAALLTPQGRIVADLHVLLRPEALWLETDAEAVKPVLARLERYIVADDVRLADLGAATARLGLEGPEAPAILAAAAGGPVGLAADACADLGVGGADVAAAAFGWSGEAAFQIFAPAVAAGDVAAALARAGEGRGLVRAGAEALEVLRIEAGVPRYPRELGEQVLPPEARLERAVSTHKGCYTGQEVVARLESRGRVKHLLVGLRLEGGSLPAIGAAVCSDATPIGEVTSACRSPAAGAIALAYVRRPHDQPGTVLSVEGRLARVSALPFAGAGAA